ncbi:hypothetical protein ACLOJK_010704 [Asimina triloba]
MQRPHKKGSWNYGRIACIGVWKGRLTAAFPGYDSPTSKKQIHFSLYGHVALCGLRYFRRPLALESRIWRLTFPVVLEKNIAATLAGGREVWILGGETRMAAFPHFAAGNDESAGNLSSNSSSSLTTLFRRADNRTLFARQGSDSRPCFMRQSSVTQVQTTSLSLVGNSINNKAISAISAHQDRPVNRYGLEDGSKLSATPMFSRPSQRSAPQELESSATHKNLPSKFQAFESEKFYDMSEAPSFSRPARTDPHLFGGREHQSGSQEHEISANGPPKFARSGRGSSEQKQPLLQKLVRSACTRRNGAAGTEWSPRADIAVCGSHYIVTVELPGVNSSNIKVELNDRNLIVTGKRSTPSRKMMRNVTEDMDPEYLQKEISRGPYQFVWPLPADVDKHGASAEFM